MFMINTDSRLFTRQGGNELTPLYEGKMIQAYDHRAASVETRTHNLKRPGQPVETSLLDHLNVHYVTTPQFWVASAEVKQRLPETWAASWLLVWKDITSTTNERTFIASFVPLSAVGNSLYIALPTGDATHTSCLCANFNSFVLDYIARQKVGGLHLNAFYVKQMPILEPGVFDCACVWTPGESGHTYVDWLVPTRP